MKFCFKQKRWVLRAIRKISSREARVPGMQSGTPQHNRIFDKMDIINTITHTYSCSIKAVDTRYGNKIYSTGFHCARFQQWFMGHKFIGELLIDFHPVLCYSRIQSCQSWYRRLLSSSIFFSLEFIFRIHLTFFWFTLPWTFSFYLTHFLCSLCLLILDDITRLLEQFVKCIIQIIPLWSRMHTDYVQVWDEAASRGWQAGVRASEFKSALALS